MKRPVSLLPPLLLFSLPLGAAQNAPTCETVLAELENTAAATQSVTRTLTIRAGERELSHSVVQGRAGRGRPQDDDARGARAAPA